MEPPFRIVLKVRHYEADDYGHVNHANYVHYLETARIEALDAIGMSLRDMRAQGFLLLASEIAVKYHSPANPGDTLEITTYITEIRGARTLWSQEVRDQPTRRLIATAQVTGAFVQDGGRAVRVPASFRERLTALRLPATGNTETARPRDGRTPGSMCLNPELPAPAGDKEPVS